MASNSRIDVAAQAELLATVGVELEKLGQANYRALEGVPVEEKQLRNLRSLYAKLNFQNRHSILNFARCVHDIAGPYSQLSRLVEQLHQQLPPE